MLYYSNSNYYSIPPFSSTTYLLCTDYAKCLWPIQQKCWLLHKTIKHKHPSLKDLYTSQNMHLLYLIPKWKKSFTVHNWYKIIFLLCHINMVNQWPLNPGHLLFYGLKKLMEYMNSANLQLASIANQRGSNKDLFAVSSTLLCYCHDLVTLGS